MARFAAVLTRLALLAGAALSAWQPALAADDFLEPEKAFQFSARQLDPKTVEITFDIAPGYYLYREQFKFAADGATLGTAQIPPGKVKWDQTFEKDVETYRNVLKIVLPVEKAPAQFRLVTTSQGCADAGLCYPPQQAAANVSLAGFGGSGIVTPADVAGPSKRGGSRFAKEATPAPSTAAGGELGAIESVLRGGTFWSIVGAFFLAGMLLSLTPCVLPMLPIVSSIIVGQAGTGATFAAMSAGGGAMAASARPMSRSRGFGLAASYSFGMAVVYTLFGVAAGLAGEGLAAALQNPWVLGVFAAGLVALALSMFGFYNLQMPSAVTCRFAAASQKLPAGHAAGVFAMGGVSALIVSPCVAAPLAGALLYLSQTGDVWLGGTALFSLATGMSMPLLLVGASAGALLPKAGTWMIEVKAVFGLLLLGVALWTVQPVLPGPLALALWGALALGAAAMVISKGRAVAATAAKPASAVTALPRRAWRHALGALLGLVGCLQIVGAAAGGTDPLQPLARFSSRSELGGGIDAPQFVPVKNVATSAPAVTIPPMSGRLMRRVDVDMFVAFRW